MTSWTHVLRLSKLTCCRQCRTAIRRKGSAFSFHTDSKSKAVLAGEKQKLSQSGVMSARKTKIGTHNGTFHCDEVFACYMLKTLPEYKEAEIVRSRDPQVLRECDIVVDVGGEYDPSTHRYDHHQRSFDGTMDTLTNGLKPWKTKLSSAGLVYLHFGRRVLSGMATDISEESGVMEELYDRVYTNFVEEIDAVDNGINDRDGAPRYYISSTISQRVGRLNPKWNEPQIDSDERFSTAMELVAKEFGECIWNYRDSWLPAKSLVMKALEERFEVDSSGEVVKLEKFCPWKEHLHHLEKKEAIGPVIKFVLYQESEGGKWRIQAVPKHLGTFENRLSLPESWRGYRDLQLSEIAQIDDCVFVHSSGFIGGNKTFQGVLEMAKKSLASSDID